MKTRIYSLSILFLFSACSTYGQDLVGTYQSERPNLLKQTWNYIVEGYNGFIKGSELNLKRDSSFQLVTCSNIMTGTWYAESDTLYLKHETNRWRDDSLHQHGFNGEWPESVKYTEKVIYNDDKLIFNTKLEGDQKAYDVLEKIK